MTISFLDLGRLHASIRPELDAAFDQVVRESSFIGGAGHAFEEAFAAAHGATAAAGCGSGTDALALALRALGIGPGDEVIVPSMTFVASAEAVVHVGATPVIADVDPHTLLLTADTVAAVTSTRTRAVMPVHLYGHVVPFDLLARWRNAGFVVVEDAAQAHLARWSGACVGSVGHATCFSFYPGKNLGALGDAGLVLSGDAAVVEEVRRLRDHGRTDKYVHDEIGSCSRLDGLQAALLLVKLRHLPSWTAARQRVAERYRRAMGGDLVPWEEGAVHHLLVARTTRPRAEVIAGLKAKGIATGVHYPVPLSRQPSLDRFARPTPSAELAAEQIVSLPMDPLLSDDEIDVVAAAWSDLQ